MKPFRWRFACVVAVRVANCGGAESGSDGSAERRQRDSTPPLRAVERVGPLPLSFAQQRLWFLDQLEPGSAFYNSPLAVRLTGGLDVAAFEQTLSEIMRRHESLRTRFVSVDGQPQQMIDAAQA